MGGILELIDFMVFAGLTVLILAWALRGLFGVGSTCPGSSCWDSHLLS